jgi:hydroxymethylpyrimidine kinase/phosphomethylpyrimidine kinase
MMPKEIPVAMTIAGSDSGGGAGIQADLKTFAALGVHGTTVISCLTAQNPARVVAMKPCTLRIFQQQLEAVFEEIPPAAIKTGMLYSSGHVRIVAAFLKNKKIPLVVDPVMISTSGTRLLQSRALTILKKELLPRALLVTPNIAEAEILIGCPILSIEDMDAAARQIQGQFGCAVLVKGGHQPRDGRAVDIFFDGKNRQALSAPFVEGLRTHGTGCVYSAAICAALAHGQRLPEALQTGKEFVTRRIKNSYRIGRHFAM